MTDVLLATDSDHLAEVVRAALSAPGLEVRRVDTGQAVRPAAVAQTPDLVVLDLQIGNMGGMATCLDLRLESGVDRMPRVPIMMLLDRSADIFLARRADADGWLVKPLDAFRLRRAATTLLDGGTSHEEPAVESS